MRNPRGWLCSPTSRLETHREEHAQDQANVAQPDEDDPEQDFSIKKEPIPEDELDMTPMVDVTFLLLIFFMVSTSFVKQSQITISLPDAESPSVVEETPEQIDIMITETGRFLVNGRELINNRAETIRNALQKTSNGDHTLPLTISADANAKHQFVVTAMDVAGRLGFTQINIATVNDAVEE